MSGSRSPRVRVLLVLGALLHVTAFVRCSTLQRSELGEAAGLYKELEDLQDVVDQAILISGEDLTSAEEDPQFTNTLNDLPLLRTLLQTAIQNQFREMTGKRFLRDLEGQQLAKRSGLRKRGFDSISQSSGFGMPRGSFGSGNGGGENLTFTFESLFPAIARGLRSTK